MSWNYCGRLTEGTSVRGVAGRSDVVHELIDGLFRCPRDTAEQRPLNLVIGKIGVDVALHPNERSSRLTAGECVFVGPDLRHDFSLVIAGAVCWRDAGGCQHMDRGIFRPRHLEEGFIRNRDIGHVLHDGIRLVHHVCNGSAHPRCSSLLRASLRRRAASPSRLGPDRTTNREN